MGRPMRGSRLESLHTPEDDGPPSLSTLDSAFQLQEFITALVRLDPSDVERIVKVPGKPDDSDKDKDIDSDIAVDEACWIYEQLRRLAQDLTHPLITSLQQECTRQTCPEMKAGEWLYLCVAHGNSGAMEHCCAIDYIIHTLDSATALLNSPRAFPSRISIPLTSHRHFPSLARRLGRIFAHAYHHHRLLFDCAEAESALYARFLALSRRFDLVPAEFLVIPSVTPQGEEQEPQNVTLLKRDPDLEPIIAAAEATAPSPRIGGRARTDTMLLSEGYHSPRNNASPSRSPRRVASPLAGTLEREQEKEECASRDKEIKEETSEMGDTADPDDVKDVGIALASQVISRDFALEILQRAQATDAERDKKASSNHSSPPSSQEPTSPSTILPSYADIITTPESLPEVKNPEIHPFPEVSSITEQSNSPTGEAQPKIATPQSEAYVPQEPSDPPKDLTPDLAPDAVRESTLVLKHQTPAPIEPESPDLAPEILEATQSSSAVTPTDLPVFDSSSIDSGILKPEESEPSSSGVVPVPADTHLTATASPTTHPTIETLSLADVSSITEPLLTDQPSTADISPVSDISGEAVSIVEASPLSGRDIPPQAAPTSSTADISISAENLSTSTVEASKLSDNKDSIGSEEEKSD